MERRVLALQKGGLDMAASTFFNNDLCYPCPLSTNTHEQELSSTFRSAYHITSHAILSDETDLAIRELPEQFIEILTMKAEIKRRKRERRRAEAIRKRELGIVLKDFHSDDHRVSLLAIDQG
jgi:hypothetical protein